MRIALLTVTVFTLAFAVAPAAPVHAQTTGSSVEGYSEPGGSIVSEVGGATPGTRGVPSGGDRDRGSIDAGPGDRAAGGPTRAPSGDVLDESASGAAPSAATPPAAGGTPGADGGTGVPLTPVPPTAQGGGDPANGGSGDDEPGNPGGGRGDQDAEESQQGFGDGSGAASAGGEQQASPGEVRPGSLGFGVGARDVALVLVASCMLLLIGVGLGSLARLERTL